MKIQSQINQYAESFVKNMGDLVKIVLHQVISKEGVSEEGREGGLTGESVT